MKRLTLAAVILLPLLAVLAFAQSSTAKAKQSALNKALSKALTKKNEIRSQLRKKTAETNQMMDDIHNIDSRMTRLMNLIDQGESDLKESKATQQKLGADLRTQTVKFDEVRAQVSKRIKAIYAEGDANLLNTIVSANSLGDLATRQAFVERVAEKDHELFTQVRVLRDQILAKKKEQDRVVAKIAKLNETQKSNLAALSQVRKEKKQVFSVLKAEQDYLEDQYNAMQEESAKLENQIAAIQAASGGTPVFKGKFILPVHGRFSSPFGMRVHPISHVRKMHTGQDIAAGSGTPIKAAGSGKVITASYIRGYGNTVVLDHGGKISTLYGHCSRIFVRVGQYVTQGQKIAAVGSTGYATGPHLHFEVRVNGKPVNPMGYVSR